MLRRRQFDIMLLDEQMPGKRGLETYRDVREIAPNLPVVMVTKSEEDATLKEAIGANIRDYLVKPINPRQVLSIVTQILEGPRIRQQAIAREFVEWFRAIEMDRDRNLDYRGWIDRFDKLMRWDVDLAAAGEMGLYDSLRGLYPDMHREFAAYMKTEYPAWLKNLEGNRPPLSIDVVSEFLLPVLQRDRAAVFIVVDCLRLDQWRVLEPLLAPFFDVETTHYFDTEHVTDHWDWVGKVEFYRRSLTEIFASVKDAGLSVDSVVEPIPTQEFFHAKPDSYARLMRQPEFLILKVVRRD
jgi:CheY-like chemotaxis protein